MLALVGVPARRLAAVAAALALLATIVGFAPSAQPSTVEAAHTPNPGSVTIAGSLQSEAGCPGDWQPDCATTHLGLDANDDVWQGSWTLPAGSFEYKAALDNAWTENYGAGAQRDGANIPLNLGAERDVKFYYDHKSHWITDNVTSVIAIAPGSFQSELGCSGDWQPDCLRSWLQDPDGNGIYGFDTTALPAGSYEAKVALNESWDVNYGAGGVPNGDNIQFTVPADGALVKFRYDAVTHVLSILAGHARNNDVEWAGLRHDSRDLLYRTPGGAVPAGTPVIVRFRTFHNDVSGVRLRVFDLDAGGQSLKTMHVAASNVSCYEPGLEAETCDFWAVTLPNADPNNLWYRFVVSDGTDTDHYADNTSALDGGLGAPSDEVIDNSYALMVHEPGFESPAWARNAVIYQIFPDRFRNGRTQNDPVTGDARYDDPVLKLPWGTLPEGYCRNYTDGNVHCPWRFDDTPPPTSPTTEQPRGRDYMGGDLRGVDQKLDYLASLGVTAIYFNPIFDAGSNHSYDTQSYRTVDPYFGTQKDWTNLVAHAEARGIRIILDGVFNHMSSDSPFFDRYHHYPEVGACESATSLWRSWFTFHDVAPGTGSCVSSTGVPNAATYDGWFGFDSIPVLTKTNAEVQQFFLTQPNSVARRWLKAGAGGWRMDVSGDPSFPAGYWEDFREVVKDVDEDALTISETWQKDSTLLRMIRGDRLDTTMNYRLRDAVIALLAPGNFDSKGFADSGRVISPTEFANRLASVREDYPDAAYYALMNLLDSHDTERLLWTLTPGAETTAEKELDASNVAAGKRRVQLASLIQFGVPGAPTVYYGDEVGITGDDDPDDRRTYPWADLGGAPDSAMFAHYSSLADLRAGNPALTEGDFRILLTNDDQGTVAFGRRTTGQAAIVAVNRSGSDRTLRIPVAGFVPNGTAFEVGLGVGVASGASATVVAGELELSLPGRGGAILVTGDIDLAPPAAPNGLTAAEGNGEVALNWSASAGAAGYHVYRSPLTGGGFVRVTDAPITSTELTDTGLENGRTWFFVVTAVDAAGNESAWSNEAAALPHLTIGWANLQWPPTLSHTISAVDRTDTVYGQVWIDGETNEPGATPGLRAQLGFGPDGSEPSGNDDWVWVEAAFNVDAGNNDEFQASLLPDEIGTYDYAYRYSTTEGRDWVYADLDGIGNGYSPAQAGALAVTASTDTTAPAVPGGLEVAEAAPAAISLDWDDNAGDATLYGYEVGRSTTPGGPYEVLGLVTTSDFADASVEEGTTYVYAVRAVDLSFNRSAWSAEVEATAEARTVTLVFNVTVPSTTDGTGRSVYIAGFLDRLDGGHPQWNPGATVLTRIDATHWTIQFTGREGVQLAYKYTLGDWEHVEKGAACDEISDRLLTLSYGTTGTQTVSDTVLNWRNVAPCGN